ncbi:hypothetical protein CALVIDRAFT_534474 [Calocera viscosa TUFC12733]|uniref:Uncharacterized protein n=1 Tax=Calocera viscosa (strain TUFC12733) TaxID=1330018 RepID=A0A167Q756_CALVF|nr:hypothetical protein CALVIDRAFT_534474 [Calocera viscosa TUFC12733]
MPRGVRSPMLEWTVKVVGLRGEQKEVWTAEWEGTTALRERIAKEQGIYAARKLILHSWPSKMLVEDGWTVSENSITHTSTLFCSLPSQSLPSVFRSVPLPDPPPAISPLPPPTSYPKWIERLPTHTSDDFLTLYASILTYHFPPYQSFHIHTYTPPNLPQAFAVHHSLHTKPLLVLSFMSVADFDKPDCRVVNLSGLLATCTHLLSPCIYLLSVFGHRWRAIKSVVFEDGMKCSSVAHPDTIPPSPAPFPGDCSADTWAPTLLSPASFHILSDIADELKLLFLPHWSTPNQMETIVRLPRYRIIPATSMIVEASDQEATHAKCWLDAPEVIEILPPLSQNKTVKPPRQARVRLPRTTK